MDGWNLTKSGLGWVVQKQSKVNAEEHLFPCDRRTGSILDKTDETSGICCLHKLYSHCSCGLWMCSFLLHHLFLSNILWLTTTVCVICADYVHISLWLLKLLFLAKFSKISLPKCVIYYFFFFFTQNNLPTSSSVLSVGSVLSST